MELLATTEYIVTEEEKQLEARYDLQTQFSELIDGAMHTEFDLVFDGIDLYGPDGRGLGEVTRNGLKHAREAVKTNPNMWFDVRRSSLESEERLELIDMARGNGSNTMIVVSDFPEELNNAKEDVGGYNITRKQTMLRVLIRQEDGSIKMHSQTLDGSNRQALEGIYDYFGTQAEPGELLGQRIKVDLGTDVQSNIVGSLISIYDKSLNSQYGGEWYAGRRPADISNTYDFVCRQQDLIGTCIRLQQAGQLNSKIMYDVSATMQKRFENKQTVEIIREQKYSDSGSTRLFIEINQNGDIARQSGKMFSACGQTLRADNDVLESGFEDAGYGDDDSLKECTFTSKECPECHAKNVLTTVTATKISGSCGCSKRIKK